MKNNNLSIQLLVSGGSIQKVYSFSVLKKIQGTKKWLQEEWDQGERIHQRLQKQKEENLCKYIRKGLPIRFY